MTAASEIGMVHGPGPAGSWDSERVSGPRVLRCADGVWRMWYYGRDPSFDRQVNLPTGRCGLATSSDGVHWQAQQGPLTMGAVLEPHPDQNRFRRRVAVHLLARDGQSVSQPCRHRQSNELGRS